MSAVLGGDVPGDVEEEPVRELHDVGLVHGRDLAAAVAARMVERELDDLARARLGERLDRDAGVPADAPVALAAEPVEQLVRVLRSLLELDAGVEVLRVLADDDQVDARVAGAHARIALAGAHLRVEVERLAQADVDRAEAAADRRRDRPFERRSVLPDRLEHVLRKRVAVVLGHHVGAGLLHVPVELDPRRLEDAAGRLGELGAGAVAGNQGHAMRHSAADSTDGL